MFSTSGLSAVALASRSAAFGGAIHDAVALGELGKIKTILNDDPSLISSRDRGGETALHIAALNGRKNVAEFLVSNQADVDALDERGETPLHLAASEGHKDVVELLLASNADVNAWDRDGWTPLHFAASKGYKDVAELLLASKADVNAKDNAGGTCRLHESIAANNFQAQWLPWDGRRPTPSPHTYRAGAIPI